MSPAAKPDAKKRKSSGGGSSVAIKAAKTSSSSSLQMDFGRMEEQQSENRTAECDSELFASNCSELKGILDSILKLKLALKKEGQSSKLPQELSELKVKFGLAFINLKKLNRLDKIRTKRIRESTAEVMQRVDSFHLQLQNLRYEVMHLEKEVARCLQFRSRDQDIQMIAKEQFFKEAPDTIKDKVDEEDDEHKLHLARLEFENVQRKEMHEHKEQLDEKKKGYEDKIREKRTNLASLKPQLASILERTKSVQAYLDMPLDEERDQLSLGRHLPPPLFVVFSEMRAYGYACDKKLKVQISGDIEEAKSANAARRNAKEDAADDAADDPNEEEEEQDRRKKKKRANDASSEKPSDFSKEEKLKKVFAVHPLTVNVKIEIGDGNFVELDFGYLTSLEAIAVKVSLVFNADNKEVLSHTHVELLGTQSLLAHLLQDEDAGTTSPNPATVYLLKHKLRMEKFPKSKMAEVGAAYKWAQLLGGLRFPDNADPEEEVRVDHAVCQTEIERIVGAIRRRFVARLALQRQISVLEAVKTKAVDLPIPKDLHDELPAGVQNRLHSWCAVKHEEYFSLKETQHLTRSGAVTSHDFFYRLQLNREPAILIALIAIGSQYPQTPPVFYLNLHWNNDEFNLRNSEKIRALELEINTYYEEFIQEAKTKHVNALLSLQIRRLMTLFDVLLESWESKPDFPREKMFIQPVRGRKRLPPLKYHDQLKMFSQ